MTATQTTVAAKKAPRKAPSDAAPKKAAPKKASPKLTRRATDLAADAQAQGDAAANAVLAAAQTVTPQNATMLFAVQQLTTPVAAPATVNPLQALVNQATALAAPKAAKTARVARVEQNGIKRPLSTGGICDQMWCKMDEITAKQGTPCTIAQVKEALPHFNQVNLMGEYASWRKFNGITGRLPRAPKEAKPVQLVMTHDGNP